MKVALAALLLSIAAVGEATPVVSAFIASQQPQEDDCCPHEESEESRRPCCPPGGCVCLVCPLRSFLPSTTDVSFVPLSNRAEVTFPPVMVPVLDGTPRRPFHPPKA